MKRRKSDAFQQRLRQIVTSLENAEEEKTALMQKMQNAEKVYRVVQTLGTLDKMMEQANRLEPFEDFFDSMATLEQKIRATTIQGEVLSREILGAPIFYRGWTCKSTSGGVKRTFDMEKLVAAGLYSGIEIGGKPLIKATVTVDTEVWKAAVEENLIDETLAVKEGFMSSSTATRRKYFKRGKNAKK